MVRLVITSEHPSIVIVNSVSVNIISVVIHMVVNIISDSIMYLNLNHCVKSYTICYWCLSYGSMATYSNSA